MRFVMERITVLIFLMSGCCLAESVNNCTTVDDDLRTCYSIYQPVDYEDLNNTWQQNCENIECFLQCMSDAIGDCYLTDKYFAYEMKVLTVNYRASCANLDINVESLLMCQPPFNYTCLIETNVFDALTAAVEYLNNTDYAMYKEAYCNYTRLQQKCLSVDVTESCNTTVADFYQSILTVSTSLSQCGNEQSHEYFTIYNSSLNCLNPYTIGTTQKSTLTNQTSVTTSSFSLTPSSISISSMTSSPLLTASTQSSMLSSSLSTSSSSSSSSSTTSSTSTLSTKLTSLLSSPSSMASSTSPTQSTSTSSTKSSTTTSSTSTLTTKLTSILSTSSSITSSTSPTQSTSTSSTKSSNTTSSSLTSSTTSSTASSPSSSSSPTSSSSSSSASTSSSTSSFSSSTSSLTSSTTSSSLSTSSSVSSLTTTSSSSTESTKSSSTPSTSSSVYAETTVPSTVEHTSPTTSSTNTLAGCSYSELISRLEQCLRVSMDLLNTSTTEQILKDFCDDIECNVQCYINSVGECYKEDQLFTFDTETTKVVSRSYCNNYTETLSAIETCYFDDQSCFSSFTSAFTADILTLYIAGNYSEYRQQYCSLLSTLQSCLSGSTVSGCSLQQANLLKDIYLVSFSYSKCGEQNHAYFTTYGYDVTCGSKACLSNSFWFFAAVFVTVRKFIV